HRRDRGGDAGAGPRAGRDDGRHLRDRQRPRLSDLAVLARLDDRLDHRQRVHGGHRRAAHRRADLAGPGALHHHLRRAGARADADRTPADPMTAARITSATASPRLSRRLGEGVFLIGCWVATILALIALAAILTSLLGKGLGGFFRPDTHGFDTRIFTMSTPAPGSEGGLLNAIL